MLLYTSVNDNSTTDVFDNFADDISGAIFSPQMNDVLLGAMGQDFPFDASTATFLSNTPLKDFNDDVVSRNLNPSPEASTTSSQLLSSIAPSLISTSVSKTLPDTHLDVLEVLDAPNDNGTLFNFEQPSLGNLETNIIGNLGGLYDDPIDYGTPLYDAYYWRQQQGNYSCAVVAQICVYESLTGEYISEDTASNYAQQQGWFDPLSGTPMQYIGNILNVLGIGTYQLYGASLGNLEYVLASGDKPIVGLDGSEIWNPQYDWYGYPLEQSDAGHAVWVTGIDYEWDGSINIILNDSGTPSGMASVVDYFDFMNAWEDYGNFVTVADNPFI